MSNSRLSVACWYSLIFCALFWFVYSQEIVTETYLSPPVTLHPGQIANTNPLQFPLLDWPQKPIAVVSFDSEVVDDDGNAVALYDLYIHHYLIYVNVGKFSAGWCSLYNIWGIGAEMRGTVYDYPYPYAIIFDGTENFTTNLHFIRTDTVPTDDHQRCIECHCPDGTPNNPDGGIRCCQDQTYCYGMPSANGVDPKNYYLKYTFKYTEATEEMIPLTAFTYDVTAEENFDCSVEYQVSEPSVSNGNINVKHNTSTVVQDTDIVFVEIHQHIGGVNYSVEHWRDGEFIGTLCYAEPTYGNGTQVGNEDGYVVKIPACTFDANNPYHVSKGDELVLTSIYDGRHIEGGGDYHEGVMGLLLYWGNRRGPSDCESKLKTLCGDPLPKSTQECFQCAQYYEYELYYAECGAQNGWRIVQFLCKTDNGVKTPYPINSGYNDNDIYNNSSKSIEGSVDDRIRKEKMRKEYLKIKDVNKIENITSELIYKYGNLKMAEA